MDRQGNFPTAEELLCALPEKESEDVPRKITLSEYLSSPEFQRKQKMERERQDRDAFEKKMAFRSAQEQNPIKGTTETETRSEGAVIGCWQSETVSTLRFQFSAVSKDTSDFGRCCSFLCL